MLYKPTLMYLCTLPSVLEEGYLNSNRRGGSGKILKMLQEGGHFLIRGGSDKPKMLQEGGP